MANPYRVGLTGGIGSGKSLISSLFSKLGIQVIDADDIVHELTAPESPVLQEIIKTFGNVIINSDGALDKKKMRQIIFSDTESRKLLESILHPHVYRKIDSIIGNKSSTYCILSIPLLLETQSQQMVDTVLVVDCPVELQLSRVTKRDGVSEQDVKKIIASQISRTDRLKAANEVILNDGDVSILSDQVMDLHLDYSKRAQNH